MSLESSTDCSYRYVVATRPQGKVVIENRNALFGVKLTSGASFSLLVCSLHTSAVGAGEGGMREIWPAAVRACSDVSLVAPFARASVLAAGLPSSRLGVFAGSPSLFFSPREPRRRALAPSSSLRSFMKFSSEPAGRPPREINTSGHVHSYAHTTGGMEDARMRTSPSRLLLRASVLPRLFETSRPADLLLAPLLRVSRFIHPQPPPLPFPARFFFAPCEGLAPMQRARVETKF